MSTSAPRPHSTSGPPPVLARANPQDRNQEEARKAGGTPFFRMSKKEWKRETAAADFV